MTGWWWLMKQDVQMSHNRTILFTVWLLWSIYLSNNTVSLYNLCDQLANIQLYFHYAHFLFLCLLCITFRLWNIVSEGLLIFSGICLQALLTCDNRTDRVVHIFLLGYCIDIGNKFIKYWTFINWVGYEMY